MTAGPRAPSTPVSPPASSAPEPGTGGRERSVGYFVARRSKGAVFWAAVAAVAAWRVDPQYFFLPLLGLGGVVLCQLLAIVTKGSFGPPEPKPISHPPRPAPSSAPLPARPVAAPVAELCLPYEPDEFLYVLATHCVMCGRELTDLESMEMRVGTTCIKKYGPQPELVPNPDHARWQRKVVKQQSAHAALVAEAELAHREAESAWEAEVGRVSAEREAAHARALEAWHEEVAQIRETDAALRAERSASARSRSDGAVVAIRLTMLLVSIAAAVTLWWRAFPL